MSPCVAVLRLLHHHRRRVLFDARIAWCRRRGLNRKRREMEHDALPSDRAAGSILDLRRICHYLSMFRPQRHQERRSKVPTLDFWNFQSGPSRFDKDSIAPNAERHDSLGTTSKRYAWRHSRHLIRHSSYLDQPR